MLVWARAVLVASLKFARALTRIHGSFQKNINHDLRMCIVVVVVRHKRACSGHNESSR